MGKIAFIEFLKNRGEITLNARWTPNPMTNVLIRIIQKRPDRRKGSNDCGSRDGGDADMSQEPLKETRMESSLLGPLQGAHPG